LGVDRGKGDSVASPSGLQLNHSVVKGFLGEDLHTKVDRGSGIRFHGGAHDGGILRSRSNNEPELCGRGSHGLNDGIGLHLGPDVRAAQARVGGGKLRNVRLDRFDKNSFASPHGRRVRCVLRHAERVNLGVSLLVIDGNAVLGVEAVHILHVVGLEFGFEATRRSVKLAVKHHRCSQAHSHIVAIECNSVGIHTRVCVQVVGEISGAEFRRQRKVHQPAQIHHREGSRKLLNIRGSHCSLGKCV
jgi:hypothetical protein